MDQVANHCGSEHWWMKDLPFSDWVNQQKAFEEVYSALNAEQKLAVGTIDGPVMVIAGPGTGKTQILGARIGKILIETDTAPENILCLTSEIFFILY